MSKTVKEGDFEESLLRTIDVQLRQVFGETATSIIYRYLRTNLSLQQEEIPSKLQVFTDGLDKFLSSGAIVIENVILRNLYSDFGYEFQAKEGYEFEDYVDELKRSIGKAQEEAMKA